ncbi:hypothetical protein [Nocardia africana]|uniref:Uncharacterized protein n=1 Tax=Nocardia africana TaxID=134964 RepID=A0A378X2Z7_9NOCA|nr:hypothetical protein [Nocardia africana]MCC3316802.1 hypothetical protein [Nocardia africana]SUA47522.1 Uncharacterised protein [Nocardia africana]
MSRSPVPLDEQQPIDKNLGGHVLRHLYGGETHAELSITVQDRMIQYSLVSELQSANIPDDDLVQAICDLVDLHERFGSGLCGANYRFVKNPDGRWNMVGRFSYESDTSSV